MKLLINFAITLVGFSVLKATEFSEEEIKMFLPFIRRWVPPPCPINQLYRTCVSKCSDCTERGRCPLEKCEEGCDCAPRFFKVKPDGLCEPVANCPRPECGENEIFRECGPVCETCATMECRIVGCDHKCYCMEGYLRNKEGNCIPKEECLTRTRCSRTEEWAESGPVDEFCLHGAGEDLRNETQDIAGCYCKEGYKRNVLGRCINETLCPFVRCFGNEVYRSCIPRCNTTCRNNGDADCTEDDNCYPGCFCKPGHVMNDFRACIEIKNCSLDIDQVKILDTSDVDENTGTTLPPTSSDTDDTTIATDLSDTTIATDSTPASATTIATDSASTSATTIATDSTSTDDAKKFHAEEQTGTEETITITTSKQPPTASSTTSTVSVSVLTLKEKPLKKDKTAKQKETKHENVAKEKVAKKYEIIEDDDGFGNDDI